MISPLENHKVTAWDKTGNPLARGHVYGPRSMAETYGRALLKHTPRAVRYTVTHPLKGVK